MHFLDSLDDDIDFKVKNTRFAWGTFKMINSDC